MALSHDNLANYYQMNYQLMQIHKYSLSDLENMIPWEREIYVEMLVDDIKEQNKKQQMS